MSKETEMSKYGHRDIEPIRRLVGIPLRTWRKNQKISIETIKKNSGLCKQSITNIEYGLYRPSWDTILKYANGVGYPNIDLLFDAYTEAIIEVMKKGGIHEYPRVKSVLDIPMSRVVPKLPDDGAV